MILMDISSGSNRKRTKNKAVVKSCGLFVIKYVKKCVYKKYKIISQYDLPFWQVGDIIIIESRKLFLGGQYEKGDRK